MQKPKKVKLPNSFPSAKSIMFSLLVAAMVFLAYKNLVAPLFNILTSQPRQQVAISEGLSQEQVDQLVERVEEWKREGFGNFSLQLPNFKQIASGRENTKILQIEDPESGQVVTVSFTITQNKDIKSIDDLLPEEINQMYGFTRLSSYDALRVGPPEPPYDRVTYFIVEGGKIIEIDAAFSTPVSFLDQILSSFKLESDMDSESETSATCVIAGCSGTLCLEEGAAQDQGITTCEYKEEYACYQDFGVCERQADGECGWTQTDNFTSCLESFSDM